jgi:predicted transcriptional regulator
MHSLQTGFVLPLILVLVLAVPGMAAPEYHVRSAYLHPPPVSSIPASPEEISVWDLPLGLLIMIAGVCFVEILAALKMWAILGYRRVTRSTVLEQNVRFAVFQAIQKNPGIHLQALARETNICLGTVRHHLRLLSSTGRIICSRNGSTVQFFENNGKFPKASRLILKHLHHETRRKILQIIRTDPSSGRNEIARLLQLSGATVTWHMKLLEADKIVSVERNGRKVRYLIPGAVSGYLDEYLDEHR